MSYKPVFKRPEDEISQKVEEKVKVDLDSKIRSEVDKRVTDILKEKEEKEKTDKASKIAKAVDVAKALKGESDSEKDKVVATEREKADKDILCPTCHIGHVHKIDDNKDKLVYKCTKDGCGYEAVMVPKHADYKCSGCGMAIKKPEDPKSIDGCPFCGGTKAIRFDWSRIWNIKK